MNDNENGVFVPDFSMYQENRVKYPWEELLQYAGNVWLLAPMEPAFWRTAKPLKRWSPQ